jgi:hypothetical protein
LCYRNNYMGEINQTNTVAVSDEVVMNKMTLLFEYIRQFEKLKQEESEQKKRLHIGFK